MQNNPLKLNLGCGGDIRDGWINIDLYPCDSRVLQYDVSSLPFEAGSVSVILAQDVLEHISHLKVRATLMHWISILRQGGTLTIRCPDIEKQCHALLDGTWSYDLWSYMVFGGQDRPGNEHRCGFTLDALARQLEQMGMKVTSRYSAGQVTSSLSNSDNPNLFVTAIKL